jgi:hypothetical protein
MGILICALWTVYPGEVFGQTTTRPSTPAESTPPGGQPAAQTPSVVYKPPLRGAPADRVGGGTRGIGLEEVPQVMVLAPDHPGLTTQRRPSLFWYISRPTSRRVDFTLRDEQTGVVVLSTTLPSPQSAGIQRINLSQFDVDLAVGKDYRWIVNVVLDPNRPSRDILSAGILRRVEGPKLPADKIEGNDRMLAAAWYAAEGLWYDALEAVGEAVDAAPSDKVYRNVRASLLDQVGLCQVARFEMAH